MREKTARFGKSNSLIGILSTPDGAQATGDSDRPAVIVANSGILHRVGACRVHVKLARRLAEEGYPVLRFDFSGIGDSAVRRDDLAFEESAVVELQEAMNYLTSATGAKKFVVMGLCSGADMAFSVAEVDTRVVGLAVFDPWAYRTPAYYWKHYGPRVFKLSSWTNAWKVRYGKDAAASNDFPKMQAVEDSDMELPTYVREFPPRAESADLLKRLIDRGTEICAVFTGGQSEFYNYEGQFEDAFKDVPMGGQLLELYWPGADHIFTGLGHQKLLVDTMSSWMADHWKTDAVPAAEPSAAVSATPSTTSAVA